MANDSSFSVRTLLLVCCMMWAPVILSAERYVIDGEQSFVRIAAKMCEPDLLKGEFGDVSGEILLDEINLEKSRVSITVAATNAVFDHEFHQTDNIKDIVLGEKLLRVIKFPLITFESTEIIPTGSVQFESYGKQSNIVNAIVKGNLSLVGVTRPFEMEATFHASDGLTNQGRMLAAFSTFGTFKRSDFGINYGLDRVGIRRMGDDVMVMTSITATQSR